MLDHTQRLIRTIFLGLWLQYKALDMQREQVLGCAPCTTPKTLQVTGFLITLSALLGFWQQSKDIAEKTCVPGECPDRTETNLSAVILIIALMRLMRLLNPSVAEKPLVETEIASDPLL